MPYNDAAAIEKVMDEMGDEIAAVIVWQGRFWLTSFIPGGFLGMTLFFATGLNWWATLLGFLAGNSIGYISEYTGRKLSEATSKDAA